MTAEINEKLENLYAKQRELTEMQSRIQMEKELVEERERLFFHREGVIEDGKKFMAEKEILLAKREAALWSEKEKMVGNDSLDIKRSVILPSLQQKWEAEKNKLDAERVQLLQNTPKVWESLEARRIELENIVSKIKSKPSSTTNQVLLIENEGRLKQLLDIITLIDSSRGVANGI